MKSIRRGSKNVGSALGHHPTFFVLSLIPAVLHRSTSYLQRRLFETYSKRRVSFRFIGGTLQKFVRWVTTQRFFSPPNGGTSLSRSQFFTDQAQILTIDYSRGILRDVQVSGPSDKVEKTLGQRWVTTQRFSYPMSLAQFFTDPLDIFSVDYLRPILSNVRVSSLSGVSCKSSSVG